MARPKGPKRRTDVEAIQHGDTRTNIPTEELREFIPDEDEDVRDFVRWPRDPALDPQLVWQGKDALDGEELAVPVVPVYIQEKIRPRAIIEDLRRNGQRDEAQLDFFADFNGIGDLERKLEFYQHDQHWSNRMILGDSLLVMTSLAEKESLRGKVQCIYLDPPYGIKFASNWQVSTRKRDVRDGRAEDTTRQPEQVRAFRDTWSSASTPISPTCATASRSPATCWRRPAASSFRSAMRTSTGCAQLLDEVFGAKRTSSAEIAVKKTSSLSSRQVG